jgi:beta-lactamase regulating signal transducer with metallopeptidase domain
VDRLLQIALTNALAATLLALPAAGLSRLIRRPPITRALWIVVLLKLLTPPIWSVPMGQNGGAGILACLRGQSVWWSRHSRSPSMSSPQEIEPARRTASTPPALACSRQTRMSAPPDASGADAGPIGEGTIADDSGISQEIPSPTDTVNSTFAMPRWTVLVAGAWVSGSVVYLALISVSVWRVGRLIRRSRPASPLLQARVEKLSRGLGLRHSPSVAFVDRLVPPMLCPLGTAPRIVLPERLWDRLDEDQQNTVLAHELAHLRARDHWMRMLELVAAVLYWWHPLVWWSRHELREAAEQCCDAWVVSSMPRLARSYAAAIVEAIEFISSAPTAVPALASTMGQFTDLRRRLVMIKQGNAMRSLTRPALAAVFGAAGFVLPLSPSFAQEAAPRAPEAPVAVTVSPAPVVGVAPAPTAPVAIEIAADDPTDPAQQAKMKFEFQALPSAEADPSDQSGGVDRAEYQKARAEVASLRAQLRAAERRLAAMERGGRKRGTRGGSADEAPGPKPSKTPSPSDEAPGPRPSKTPSPSYAPMNMKGNFNQDQNDAFARATEKLRAASDQLSAARDRSRQALERRLDAMERQMSEISNQLRQLRRQMDRPNPEPQKQ